MENFTHYHNNNTLASCYEPESTFSTIIFELTIRGELKQISRLDN